VGGIVVEDDVDGLRWNRFLICALALVLPMGQSTPEGAMLPFVGTAD
jgi:hypothetical protein